jgi:lipoic acid synthetase
MDSIRKPEWLKIKINNNPDSFYVESILEKYNLNTVCREANCPNRIECFNSKTATFMILGKNCTRNCTFCNVTSSKPEDIDTEEPSKIVKAVDALGLEHVVITSVTRDDLEDGGAGHFAAVINALKSKNVSIEVLIPDFKGDMTALKKVTDAKPDIINHNLETVPELYPEVRPGAEYEQSLNLLKKVKQIDKSIYTKSGIMLGLDEKDEEIIKVLLDLKNINCDFITIGQYLAPSKKHHPVIKYYHPKEFEYFKNTAIKLGIKAAAGPFVRSSYKAKEMLK